MSCPCAPTHCNLYNIQIILQYHWGLSILKMVYLFENAILNTLLINFFQLNE